MGKPQRKKALRTPRAQPRAIPRPPPAARPLSDTAFAALAAGFDGNATNGNATNGNTMSGNATSTAPSPNAVRIDSIDADPEQPRRHFSDQEIGELAQSIKDLGVLQPIVVRIHPSSLGRFMLVMGERRLRAATKAGLATIPAIVREVPKLRRAQLVENLQREDLEVMEIARALSVIVEEAKIAGESQASVARAIGKDRAYVTRYLKLLELLPELQALLEQKRCNDQQVLLTLDQFVREDLARHDRLKEFLVTHPDFALSRANLSAIQAALSGGEGGPRKSEKAERHVVQPAVERLLSATGVQTTVTRLAKELRIQCSSSEELARVEAWLAGQHDGALEQSN